LGTQLGELRALLGPGPQAGGVGDDQRGQDQGEDRGPPGQRRPGLRLLSPRLPGRGRSALRTPLIRRGTPPRPTLLGRAGGRGRPSGTVRGGTTLRRAHSGPTPSRTPPRPYARP